jgi:hypothetical protein
MRDSFYNPELINLEAKEHVHANHQWAEHERLVQQFQQPSQFRLVRLAVVIIAASIIAALLMIGI